MYTEYTTYLASLDFNSLKGGNFKSNSKYSGILEHVSYELGKQYLELIYTDFKVTSAQIQGYIDINDMYGQPTKYTFNYKNNIYICSPTSLRYIYHSLVILEHFKNTNSKNIVEVGCGYGGLCLAINYFSKILDITINNYNIVDLPEVCPLIKNYLDLHNSIMYSNITIHLNTTYGQNVADTDLFFISNYCYTEIDKEHNTKYSDILLPKANHGFITWQNGGNRGAYPVEKSNIITRKAILKVIDEKPQTDAGYGIYKNYFVYF